MNMPKFTAQTFTIPKLKGISEKTIEEHLKLYQGYVNNVNGIMEKLAEYGQDQAKHTYVLGELARRFSFEYNGMRNHEVYFSSLEGRPTPVDKNSKFYKTIVEACGSFEVWLEAFKFMALTRGIGWAVISYDYKSGQLLGHWVDEQHLGQLQNTKMILVLDMWEHSYVADYQPSGKKKYIEDFFANINWKKIEENFGE
jgi:Fe-Mn family superoxide dismutase